MKIWCVVNNAEKFWISFVQSQTVHLSNLDVLNEADVNDTSLATITVNQAFC